MIMPSSYHKKKDVFLLDAETDDDCNYYLINYLVYEKYKPLFKYYFNQPIYHRLICILKKKYLHFCLQSFCTIV